MTARKFPDYRSLIRDFSERGRTIPVALYENLFDLKEPVFVFHQEDSDQLFLKRVQTYGELNPRSRPKDILPCWETGTLQLCSLKGMDVESIPMTIRNAHGKEGIRCYLLDLSELSIADQFEDELDLLYKELDLLRMSVFWNEPYKPNKPNKPSKPGKLQRN